MLRAGGSGIMTAMGIPSFVEYGEDLFGAMLKVKLIVLEWW